MSENLGLRHEVDGRVVRHAAGDHRPRPHRHAELELNLVVRGTASYLLGERRYELTPGTLTWLFPGQDHVLVDESRDHELWWAVFRSSLVARTATTPQMRPLREQNPGGQFSRRLDSQRARRLEGLLRELRAAEEVDHALLNAGLAYLLGLAWRAFVDSDDVIEGVDVHPAVETVARMLRADPRAGDLTTLARVASVSPSHLSRLFKSQTGTSITRFRNQQRVQRFMLLYRDGRHTTALAAALEAGFGSYAQFYRVFRAETGGPPSLSRSEHRPPDGHDRSGACDQFTAEEPNCRQWTAEEMRREEDAQRARVRRDAVRGVSQNLPDAVAHTEFDKRFAEAFEPARRA